MFCQEIHCLQSFNPSDFLFFLLCLVCKEYSHFPPISLFSLFFLYFSILLKIVLLLIRTKNRKPYLLHYIIFSRKINCESEIFCFLKKREGKSIKGKFSFWNCSLGWMMNDITWQWQEHRRMKLEVSSEITLLSLVTLKIIAFAGDLILHKTHFFPTFSFRY
jgi:hypothetical protein